jgi:transposase
LDQAGLAARKKSARRRGAWLIFQDESGVSLTPVVRATWAPRGQTPVLRHKFNWKRMSMSAALCYRPDRSAAELVFATQAGAYNTETLIEFLGQLRDHLGDNAKISLLWDGLPSHRSRDMTRFLAGCRSWLRVERLPAYAPELNPVEGLWGNVKGTELANRCPDTIDEAMQAASAGLERVSGDTDLCFAMLRRTGLLL